MSKTQKYTIDATQEEDFPRWYKEVLMKGEILDYHDINGCYVLRPNGFAIWKHIMEFFNAKIHPMGVQEAYFPMLVSKTALEKEQDHLENFAPEVAWITDCGGKPLETPVAIRPTSETIIYPYFAKWIQSHRDLPVKINQWCNVLRWETTQTTPFIRSREFLWQEGHTAHYNREEADGEVFDILEHYASVYEDLLAVPVVRGKKSKKETFAGADFTTTVEAYVHATGRGIQAATSHSLGQNFSKMFNIKVQAPSSDGKHSFAFQNSWGLSTRSIGVCILVHSDNRGLALPPRAAPIQVVIVPCGINKHSGAEVSSKVLQRVHELEALLRAAGVRVHADLSENTSGHKYNHWEVKGVPLRIEVGPRDIESASVSVVWRMDKTRKTLPFSESIPQSILLELDAIHERMLKKATDARNSRTKKATDLKQLHALVRDKNIVLAPWCGAESCEENIKEQTTERQEDGTVTAAGAKSLCIPFDAEKPGESDRCIGCNGQAVYTALFGRSY